MCGLFSTVLKREKFYVCKAKSSFAQKEIKYLGHIVDKQGIRPDPKKVETWPVPLGQRTYAMFVLFGPGESFRKFLEHYAEIVVPLTDLTRKSRQWDWTGRCQDAFKLLKQKLTEAPLLRTPNKQLPYDVVTDASDLGIGAVLLQEGHPVAFE
jgi:hypothetical protein